MVIEEPQLTCRVIVGETTVDPPLEETVKVMMKVPAFVVSKLTALQAAESAAALHPG